MYGNAEHPLPDYLRIYPRLPSETKTGFDLFLHLIKTVLPESKIFSDSVLTDVVQDNPASLLVLQHHATNATACSGILIVCVHAVQIPTLASVELIILEIRIDLVLRVAGGSADKLLYLLFRPALLPEFASKNLEIAYSK